MRQWMWIFCVAVSLANVGCDLPQPAAMPAARPVQPPAPLQPPGSAVPAPPAIAGFDTPQAAMQRYENAKNKRDFKTQATCLTPETLQAFAGMQVANAVGNVGVERIPRALTKRGVTAEALQGLLDTPAQSRKAAVAAIVANMQDLPGLYAEVMTAKYRPTEPPPPAQITSVDIQGDRATAHVVADIPGSGPFHADVQLRKYADGWKVDDSRYYTEY